MDELAVRQLQHMWNSEDNFKNIFVNQMCQFVHHRDRMDITMYLGNNGVFSDTGFI